MTVKELREQIEEMKTAEIQLDKLYLFMKGDKKLNQEITIKAQLSEMVDDLLSYIGENLEEEIRRMEKIMDNTMIYDYVE